MDLPAQDDVLRQRGDFVAAVHAPIVVRAWDGTATTTGRQAIDRIDHPK